MTDLAQGQTSMHISLFASLVDPSATTQEITWGQLETLLTHEICEEKSSVRLFNFCRFSTPYRANRNVLDVSALLLDVDDQPAPVVQGLLEKLKPYQHLGYSTHRHGLEPGVFRLRIVVALARPVLASEWASFAAGVQAWLGTGLDGCVAACSQAYYLPSCPASRAPQRLSWSQPGALLDVQSLLAQAPEVAPEETPDTWRPVQVFTIEHLRKLPGEIPARLLRGEKLAPLGQRHPTRRALIYQFLCTYGPGDPDAGLLHLLTASADAPRETWIRMFSSGTARSRAEAAHARSKREAAESEAQAQALTALADQATAQALMQASASAQASAAQASTVFTERVVREIAKKAKNPVTREILLAATSGGGIPAELHDAIPEAGRWLAQRESGRDVAIIKRVFSHMDPAERDRLWQGIDLGHAQARNKEQWRVGLHQSTDERATPTEPNVRRILRLHPDMQGLFAWDRRQHSIRFLRQPPWPRVDPEPYLTDGDRGALAEWLVGVAGIAVSVRLVGSALASLEPELPSVDPIATWLESLVWDGIPRLERWLTTYAMAEDSEYTRTVGARTLIAAVARALRPGCKVDTVLILEGAQGTGKSSLIRTLCPDPRYHRDIDGVIRGDDRDVTMRIVCGSWLVELGEFTGTRQGDLARTKAFVTRPVDVYRAPYAASLAERPRTTIFIATTNDTQYLSDPTGSRRWWPVRAFGCDVGGIARDRDQIWAEAVHAYKSGAKWWLDGTDPVYEQVRAQQAERDDEDPIEADVAAFLEENPVVCHHQLFALLGVSSTDRGIAHRFRKILIRAGYVMHSRSRREVIIPFGPGIPGGRAEKRNDRFWVRPDKMQGKVAE